jgi:hypothetical protein
VRLGVRNSETTDEAKDGGKKSFEVSSAREKVKETRNPCRSSTHLDNISPCANPCRSKGSECLNEQQVVGSKRKLLGNKKQRQLRRNRSKGQTITCSKFCILATRKGQDKGSGISVKELPRDKTFKMEILN